MSRKYIRTRRKKQEVAISSEPLLESFEKPVIKISERPLILLHKLREDFEKIATAIDNYFAKAIEDLTQGKSIDLNAIVTFMQKQILLLDKVLNRVPEKYVDLKDSITTFQAKTLETITNLETMAAHKAPVITKTLQL